jgi:hypothetical protein
LLLVELHKKTAACPFSCGFSGLFFSYGVRQKPGVDAAIE